MKVEDIKLEDFTIAKYAKMLRVGTDAELLTIIDSKLSKALGGIAGGFDLALFILQKDLLIFQCKSYKAFLNQDSEKMEFYNKKIAEIQEQLEKKKEKKSDSTPYQSFLNWILSVEKFLDFAIDKENDLLYLTEATKQMLNYYEQQKQNLEKQKK